MERSVSYVPDWGFWYSSFFDMARMSHFFRPYDLGHRYTDSTCTHKFIHCLEVDSKYIRTHQNIYHHCFWHPPPPAHTVTCREIEGTLEWCCSKPYAQFFSAPLLMLFSCVFASFFVFSVFLFLARLRSKLVLANPEKALLIHFYAISLHIGALHQCAFFNKLDKNCLIDLQEANVFSFRPRF